MTAEMKRKEKYTWMNYSYRYKSPEAAEELGRWLKSKDWSGVLDAVESDRKANIYQRELLEGIESIFPLRTVKRRSTDPP